MANKNLKKLLRKVAAGHTNYGPASFPVNYNKAAKYLNAKAQRVMFNAIFRPLFKEIFAKDVAEYLAMGHPMNPQIKKGMREYAKDKAKAETKARLAVKDTAAKDYKEQQNVLPEE